MRFSGHDTFHCREQWLLKGVQLIDNQNFNGSFSSEKSIYQLGVGKNMARSIHYWLKSFSLLSDDDELTAYSQYLFKGREYDPFLEKPATLFLLQYLVTSKEYASIYSVIFRDLFKDRANFEFTELQATTFIKRLLLNLNINKFTDKTIRSDFKVFIKSYVTPVKNIKTIEDDFSAPLLSLKLISDTGRKNDLNQTVYKLNRTVRYDLCEFVFAFCILDFFDNQVAIDFTDICSNIGAFLCLNNEGVEEVLNRLCQNDKRFVFKSDAGVKQLQVKQPDLYLKEELLEKIYL